MQPIRIEIDANGRGRVLASIRVGRVGRRGPEISLDEAAVVSIAKALLPHATRDNAKAALEDIVGTQSKPEPAAEPAAEPEAAPSTEEQLDAVAGGRTRRKKAKDEESTKDE